MIKQQGVDKKNKGIVLEIITLAELFSRFPALRPLKAALPAPLPLPSDFYTTQARVRIN